MHQDLLGDYGSDEVHGQIVEAASERLMLAGRSTGRPAARGPVPQRLSMKATGLRSCRPTLARKSPVAGHAFARAADAAIGTPTLAFAG
ncbi:MAG TPA: hypothetical protein VMD55_12455 [Terracidiphilus sp.]|nr:hypothetical protein [Terracidiphilus sp.]